MKREKPSYQAVFALNLARILKENAATQSDLAKELDIDPSQVNRWVKGTQFPVKYIDEIAEFLEASFADLFEDV